MADIFNTKELTEKIRRQLKKQIAALGKLSLAVINTTDNDSSRLYIKAQKKTAEYLGINYELFEFKEKTATGELIELIDSLNADKNIDGIIIQMPLASGIERLPLYEKLNPLKDIEGVSPYNLGMLALDKPRYVPPTVLGVLELLNQAKVDFYGKDTVIIGYSDIVGKPLGIILANKFSTVTITHIATYQNQRLEFYVRSADILISAAGVPLLIKGEWIKKGAVVIDVGINHYKGKLTGDVDFPQAVLRASFITPVPSGVGPLTTLFLYENLIKAHKLRAQ